MQLGRHRAFTRRLIKEVRWAGNAGRTAVYTGLWVFIYTIDSIYFRLIVMRGGIDVLLLLLLPNHWSTRLTRQGKCRA
ncbi:hypothetical protein GGR51DRAFT_270399 [Nemania sp. FL0031]|nr:hypothetical protein GGR51DRAFT_270399 [Nemania sp. FL0031]